MFLASPARNVEVANIPESNESDSAGAARDRAAVEAAALRGLSAVAALVAFWSFAVFVWGLLLVIPGVLVLGVSWLVARASGLPMAAVVLGVMGGLYIAWWVLRLTLGKWRRTQRIRAQLSGLLRRDCCGSCGYPLRSIEVDADGCRVCPECGGAWNTREWETPRSSARGATMHPQVRTASGEMAMFRSDLDEAAAWREAFAKVPIPLRWRLGGTGERATIVLLCVGGVAIVISLMIANQGVGVLRVFPPTVACVLLVLWLQRRVFRWSMERKVRVMTRRGTCPCCGGALVEGFTARYAEKRCGACRNSWWDEECPPRKRD